MPGSTEPNDGSGCTEGILSITVMMRIPLLVYGTYKHPGKFEVTSCAVESSLGDIVDPANTEPAIMAYMKKHRGVMCHGPDEEVTDVTWEERNGS